MKVLSTTSLTKLIELIKSSFLSVDNIVTTQTISCPTDSEVVHNTGDETIGGTKTFIKGTASIKISRGSAAYTEIMTTKGDTNYTRTGGFRNIENNGINESLMYITNNDGSSIHGSISILKNTTTGDVYTSAPTPATSDNSTKIATTAFVKAQGYAVDSNVVHKAGNETIGGNKTFSGTTSVVTPAVSDNSTKPVTTAYIETKFKVVSALPAFPDSNTYYFIPE